MTPSQFHLSQAAPSSQAQVAPIGHAACHSMNFSCPGSPRSMPRNMPIPLPASQHGRGGAGHAAQSSQRHAERQTARARCQRSRSQARCRRGRHCQGDGREMPWRAHASRAHRNRTSTWLGNASGGRGTRSSGTHARPSTATRRQSRRSPAGGAQDCKRKLGRRRQGQEGRPTGGKVAVSQHTLTPRNDPNQDGPAPAVAHHHPR